MIYCEIVDEYMNYIDSLSKSLKKSFDDYVQNNKLENVIKNKDGSLTQVGSLIIIFFCITIFKILCNAQCQLNAMLVSGRVASLFGEKRIE